VQKRKLIGFCCVTAVLGLAPAGNLAQAQSSFTTRSLAANMPAKTSMNSPKLSSEPGEASLALNAAPAVLQNSAYLVREVVYNELHDHDTHGYWR